MIHLVAVDERAPAAAARRESLGDHRQRRVEGRTFEGAVWPGAPNEREQLVFAIFLARRLGDDLLRKDVQRRVMRHDAIELTSADRPQQRERLDEVVSRHRKYAALGQA